MNVKGFITVEAWLFYMQASIVSHLPSTTLYLGDREWYGCGMWLEMAKAKPLKKCVNGHTKATVAEGIRLSCCYQT